MHRRAGARDALAGALKARLRTEPLHKVTVTELARDCGLTRQAFYYHFPDVRHLAIWVFETEVAGQVHAFASELGWADGLVRLLLDERATPARDQGAGGAWRPGWHRLQKGNGELLCVVIFPL